MVMDRVHVIRWLTPTYVDVEAVRLEIIAAHKAAGRPLLGICIISDDIPPPDERSRQAMMNSMQDIISRSDVVHFVVEGAGFKNSIMRSVVAGILLIGGKRGKAQVHNTVEQALAAFPADVDTRTLLTRAQHKGIVRGAK